MADLLTFRIRDIIPKEFSEQHVTEAAVLAAEIEQFPDPRRLSEVRKLSGLVASEAQATVIAARAAERNRGTNS